MEKYFIEQLSVPVIRNENSNKLDLDNYLISPELHEDLFKYNSYPKLESCPINLNKGVYIVKFRILNKNKDERVLVYNYIYYNHRFYLSLIVFFVLRNYYIRSLGYKEWGYYSIILDKEFLTFDNVKHYIGFSGENNEGINENWLFSDIQEQLRSRRSNQDLMFYLELITKLIYVNDIKKMCNIIEYGYNKDFKNYYKLIYNMTNEEFETMNISIINPNYSILNSSVFIINDLERFIKVLKGFNFNVNQGPQKWRGQINSTSSFLSIVDMDYRESLFNHYVHHNSKLGFDKYKYSLERKHFSFNNIHGNLGNIRWFSTTSRRFEPRQHRQELFDKTYGSVTNLIESNKNLSKFDVQMKIEEFLRSQEENYFNKTNAQSILRLSEDNYDLIIKKTSDLSKLMSNWNTIKKSSSASSDEYIPWIKNIVSELGSKKISSMLIEYFMFLLSRETIKINEVYTPGIPTTEAYNLFGRKLIERYIHSKYVKHLEHLKKLKSEPITLSQFKGLNAEEFKDIYEDNFYARFAGNFVWSLHTVDLIHQELDYKVGTVYETEWYIRINKDIRKSFIRDNYKVFYLPLKLPMICEPKDYIYKPDSDENKLGGYLLNDIKYTDYIVKEKIGYGIPTILKEDNSIVDLINGLSKTPFKINQDVLDFVYTYGVEKGIVIDFSKEDYKSFIANPYKKMAKRERKKYTSIFSKIIMEKNILSIADTYSKMDAIYFPIRMDNRTRIYCETNYFDYQKSDLAKGLILFSKPGSIFKHDINVINYFKAFGANMFGNGLDKKSLNYRVKWIDDNSTRILNFENNDIINLSENKTCFLAFCFEYKRFIEFINDINSVRFLSYLPIQLDASCNGYQHLALLTKESRLFNKLNLDMSTFEDDPDDFYTYILYKTEDYIDSKIDLLSKQNELSDKDKKSLNSYIILRKIMFDRSLVKKAIMTFSYNASVPTQVDQIVEKLEQHSEGKTIYYTYKNDIKFKRFDISVFVLCIRDVINIESPKIKELSKYLNNIVSICTKLSVPIQWNTPSGAIIRESYYEKKKERIRAFSFVRSKYTFLKYFKDQYSLTKQKSSTMPNLIHSLDASSIALLHKDFKKVGNIYTIHDCFGVTADNVPKLISILKAVYMRLYSENSYLLEFDKIIRLTINSICKDEVFEKDGNFINIPNGSKYKKVPFPDVNQILTPNKIDTIPKSSYIIV